MQAKLANLGSVIRAIEQCTPRLLQQTVPPSIVHPNVCFNLFPETHMFKVHGAPMYNKVQKVIQMCVCPLLLPTGTQLEILSLRVSKEQEISDRRLYLQWRTQLPDHVSASRRQGPLPVGGLIESLGLVPDEYPVLAGSFEFGFDAECRRILEHIVRDVEYMERPDSQLILS